MNCASAFAVFVRTVALAGTMIAGTVACSSDSPAGPLPVDDRPNDVILAWNNATHDAISVADGYTNPMTAARQFAIVHLAQHDALNAVVPAFDTYAFGSRDAGADPVAAAAAAAHEVLATRWVVSGRARCAARRA